MTRTASPTNVVRWDLRQSARALWRRLLRLSHRTPQRLRLCESLPLGEHRFVAVVEFEQSRFLIGGTSASLALLSRLEDPANVPTAVPGEEQR